MTLRVRWSFPDPQYGDSLITRNEGFVRRPVGHEQAGLGIFLIRSYSGIGE